MNFVNIMQKNIDLSIIIINYNLSQEIENCLNSLLEKINTPKHWAYEIIIIDNDSPDGGLKETEKKFNGENIYFYYLNENLGFGKGCNYGFSKAKGDFICFLNPDTIIKEDIFNPMVELFKKINQLELQDHSNRLGSLFLIFPQGFIQTLFMSFLIYSE